MRNDEDKRWESNKGKLCKFTFRNEHSSRLCRRKTGGSTTRYRMFGSDRELGLSTRKCIHRKKSDHGHGRLFFKGGS